MNMSPFCVIALSIINTGCHIVRFVYPTYDSRYQDPVMILYYDPIICNSVLLCLYGLYLTVNAVILLATDLLI